MSNERERARAPGTSGNVTLDLQHLSPCSFTAPILHYSITPPLRSSTACRAVGLAKAGGPVYSRTR
jgi:hypothetical protein